MPFFGLVCCFNFANWVHQNPSMNGGRGMGEEDRLEEYGSPENSQPATKSARWKCFQTFNLEKKLNGKSEIGKKYRKNMPGMICRMNLTYRMFMVKLPFESQKESYSLISRMLIPKSLRFEVATFHRSWKGVCTATGQMAFPSSVSYFLKNQGCGCFGGVLESTDWDFLEESFKFHHSTNFHSTYFHATFQRKHFFGSRPLQAAGDHDGAVRCLEAVLRAEQALLMMCPAYLSCKGWN